MTRWRLVLRGLVHFRRSHWAVLVGTAVTGGVLVGALMVGSSVRHSLRRTVDLRLGRTELAVSSGERLVGAALAGELAEELERAAEAVLLLRGSALQPDSERRAGRVQVCGVGPGFWSLGPGEEPLSPLVPGEAVLSLNTAQQLQVGPGDAIVVRLPRVGSMPGDIALSKADTQGQAVRLTVRQVVAEEHFGRFGLRAEQVPPQNIFIDRQFLCERLQLADQANVVLLAGRPGEPLEAAVVEAALRRCDLAGLSGLSFTSLESGDVMLNSERVFISAGEEEAAMTALPGAERILTYFVNGITLDRRTVSYSFVSGSDGTWLPGNLGDNEIVINEWLAEELGARPGAEVTLSYYVMTGLRQLQEQHTVLRVREVVPLQGRAADPALMPAFPGLAEADSCSEWDPGIPIDLERIGPRDEAYWRAHRGTPKAFVSLATARRLWANRFGAATSIRFPGAGGSAVPVPAAVAAELSPAAVGLSVLPVRESGQLAGRQGVDFGQLFLGLSLFIVASSLLLTGLFYSLGLLERRNQVALFHALGFASATVTRLFLCEALVVSVLGSILGAVVGWGYNRLILEGLATLWRDTIGPLALVPHASIGAVLGGCLASICCALLVVWGVLRRMGREASRLSHRLAAGTGSLRLWPYACSGVCLLLLGVVLVWVADAGRGKDAAGVFFAAGGVLLGGFVLLCRALIGWWWGRSHGGDTPPLSLAALGGRNTARNAARSVTVIAALASSIFLVVAVGANRHAATGDTTQRQSGTGGFAFYGETALAIPFDLNTREGQEWAGIEATEENGFGTVQFLLSEGDDASCLNLNRSSRPRLLGVDPTALASRGAFRVARAMPGLDAEAGWDLLATPLPDGAIPAVADEAVLVWGLGSDVGETLAIEDEQGRSRQLRFVAGLANSVLQGSVIVAETQFRNLFPSLSGSHVMLVDAAPEQREVLADALNKGLGNRGLELVSCSERLAQFNAVENTYLAVFLALGGLGVVLGSAGLGALVLRNTAERSGELAVLRAVGYGRWRIAMLLVREHVTLVLLGVLGGAFSGIVAVLPATTAPGGGASFSTVAAWVVGICLSGLFWTLVGAWLGLRGVPVSALRRE